MCLASAASSILGCTNGDERAQGTRAPIVAADGIDSDAPPRYPAIVAIVTPPEVPDKLGLCSGTLISPSHVVTAAHCLSLWNRRQPITVLFGAAVGCFDPDVLVCDRAPVLTRAASQCSVHPDFVFRERECGEAGDVTGDVLLRNFHVDVGVLQLAQPVPIERATAAGFKVDFHRLPDASTPRPSVGALATAVGYGSTSFSAVGVNRHSLGIRRFVAEPIDGFTFGLSSPPS